MIRGIGKTRLRNFQETLFLQIDIMEKFRKLAYKFPSVLSVGHTFMRASEKLNIPLLMIEQNKKAFGETAKEILEVKHPKVQVFEKFKMSAYEVPEIRKAVDALKPTNVIIYGIEAHACVLQSSLDLMEQGYNVHVVVDGSTSFRPLDRRVALHRLSTSGAIMTTSEAVLLDLLRDSKAPNFKILLDLVKNKLPVQDPLTEFI